MNLDRFLEDLSGQGIQLWLDGEQLRYRGPRQALSPSILADIKQNKAGILNMLKEGYISRVYPLSYPQGSLWYIYQSAPDSPAYNTAMAIRLLFNVDKDMLRSSFQVLLTRHASLRTTFAMQEEKPVQQVHAYQEIVFEQIDASAWNPEELKQNVKEAHQRPFALETGPVLRVSLFSSSETDHVLLISIHHIVCDGWSMWILMEELWNIYLHNRQDKIGAAHTPAPETRYPVNIPSLIHIMEVDTASFRKDMETVAARTTEGHGRMQTFIQHLLLNAFREMGVLQTPGETYENEQLEQQLDILPGYRRLFAALLDILAKGQWIRLNGSEIITARVPVQEEEIKKTQSDALEQEKNAIIQQFEQLAAYVNLVWVCARELPRILTGKKNHIDVMFPDGSMELVEKTYQGNIIIDYFNHITAELVKTYIRERVQQDDQARIRVLEIGAGTGGTSQFVLEAIEDYTNRVTYLYTDISPAFTRYGERLLADKYPFVEFKTLDIEKDPAQQDFEPGSMDIVFASNVLHATRQIHHTLGHLKKLLKANGILIINEITRLQDMLTLTFGLTDGWWLFEDEEHRIKGSPLLNPETWQRLLEKNGLGNVKFFSLPGAAHIKENTPQHVIIAESDGVVIPPGSQPEQGGIGLAHLKHTYEDYVNWQEKMLSGAEGDAHWHYWQHRLAGDLPLLNLPLDRPRPAQQTYRGSWIPFRVDQEVSRQINQFAREAGVTLVTLLSCAYQILLHRWTGQEEILVGCPTTGRPKQAFDGIVGHFVNTVVLQARLFEDPTVDAFIQLMRQTLLEAFDHQDYPFALLVDRLNPRRDPGRPPVFQTMFVFQKPHNVSEFIDTITDFYSGSGRVTFNGLEFASFPISQQEGQFDMSIEMTGSGESLKGVLKYNQDLFYDTTMQRMAGHFLNILENIILHPEQHVSELELLGEAEKNRLLKEWNNTCDQQIIEGIKYVHQLFQHQAEQAPAAHALVMKDEQLSYRQLNRQANRLAHYLVKQGARPGDRMGICIERSFRMIIAMIAVLKTGGVLVPLDPHYPGERLALMIDDSQPSILLVNQHLAELFSPGSKQANFQVIKVDTDNDRIDRESEDDLDVYREKPAQHLSDLLYILYTSGSTGKPKGVEMPHGSIANLILWQNKQSSLSGNARTLQFTTLSFDVSFQEIFSTLSSGGALVLIAEELRQDPAALLRVMKEQAVARIFVPFVFLQMLAEAVDNSNDKNDKNNELLPLDLQEVITAGEQLRITRPIINLFKRLPGCRLHNQYGPTEAHVVTAYTLEGEPGQWPLLPPIGKPIANNRVYILDNHLKPVPIGVIGEIFLGGTGVARGYRQQPELTGEKFVKDPYGNDKDRLYRTGDLGRFLADGNIEFFGRKDYQVKIRGFRVEPAEIENQLSRHPDIDDVVVMDREDKNGIKSLCAYIVSENKEEFSVARLKEYLSGKLPPYMIPSYFVRLDRIPLLPNKKVDRRSLPEPDGSIATGTEYAAPRNEIEEKLVEIWQEILKVPKIGIHDNLFDIGGNSLITLSLQRKIDAFYPGRVKIPDLIENPTIAGLAGMIKAREASGPESPESTDTGTSERDEQLNIFLEAIGQGNG